MSRFLLQSKPKVDFGDPSGVFPHEFDAGDDVVPFDSPPFWHPSDPEWPCFWLGVTQDQPSDGSGSIMETTFYSGSVGITQNRSDRVGRIVRGIGPRWVLKGISGTHLPECSRQLVYSLTWRKHMRQPGNMVSSETLTGLASEADCLFLSQNISGTDVSVSELGKHSLMNSTQREVFRLAVSWLWHVLDWRLMSCYLVLPRTSSKHSLLMTWQSVFQDALWTP